MTTCLKDLMDAANAVVPRISVDEARKMMADGGALVLDVRDAHEVSQTGKVAGAINVSRGMLEFHADAASPYHNAHFDAGKPVIVYCASGGRSALSGKTLKDMGYKEVYNLGGFKDWVAAGGDIEEPLEAGMSGA